MTEQELKNLILKVQAIQAETQTIEVKCAREGAPTRLYDTLSSFSNQDEGGVLLFGLDEEHGFAPVGVLDAQALQKRVTEQCREMEPPVRPLFTMLQEDGLVFVSAEIPAVDASQRPCYYKGKGRLKGSWIRVGEADEPMTEYEIYSYEAYRKRCQDDRRAVPGLSLSSLDPALLNKYLADLKVQKPNLARMSDEQIMQTMGVLRGGEVSLWAALLFSTFPQAQFPQLSILATVVPGTRMGDTGAQGERFTDNRRIDGNLPLMLEEALNFVRSNMRVQTLIDGRSGQRSDLPDYPITAVREVVLNALIHRDYSIHTQGMPITLTMYTDRMEVHSPGGLYGRIRVDQLGKLRPDTRNPALATAMEVLRVSENRYSGIPTIRLEMARANQPEPVFEDMRGSFVVRLYKRRQEASLTERERSILAFCQTPRTRAELARHLNIRSVSYAIRAHVQPLIDRGCLLLERPEAPGSPHQRYLTAAQAHPAPGGADERIH